MFRKIRSSEKNTSVFREIRQEFLGTFSKEEQRANHFLNSYPKQIFIVMVVLIIISSILTFVFPPTEKKPTYPEELFFDSAKDIRDGVSGEISTILDLGDRVKRIRILKTEVERIIQLEEINQADSMFLENAIRELEYFNNQNKKNNED
ncbi:hypothetical protein P872_06100 [Rhodonellum psychrophilum GCM71 = DSM 17998]|uniref:Uncharacterized protein n=2 Tax=Rhodonellum TaxID=336827 RepID=U5BYW6_9BACT|nr:MULTISPECIES: hypothetical protein [Rhodonellum]ERM83043.1 hypothetical protein P872_06100 [Rhodonellum psychrophilum GCM71 = DSM 17998]SDZ47477.1 hypothetical protein SAMN05444412_11651 [Rhodonellum ikkaensis]